MNELFARGLAARRAFLGDDNVDAGLAGFDDFMMTFQKLVTETLGDRLGLVKS